MRTAISIVALAVIIFGCRYAYGREHLRKTDLYAWYGEDNARFFGGELPDVYVRWGSLREQNWLGVTENDEQGYLEIVLDHYDLTTEEDARATLRHEECHVATWGEEPQHGPAFQACKARLEKSVEVR